MKSHAGKQNGERYDGQWSHDQDFFKVAGKSWRQKGYIDKKYCKKGFAIFADAQLQWQVRAQGQGQNQLEHSFWDA